MQTRHILTAAVTAVALLMTAGCAVQRKQETVSAMAISVETMKGTVQLSGFAKSLDEKMSAERIARSVAGVTGVKNDIVVRS